MKRETIRDNYIAAARPILQRLEDSGFEAFLVGGCVREALRAEAGEGLNAQRAGGTTETADRALMTDIDITTNALPEEICQVFGDLAVIGTGLKHGTVTVLLPGSAAAAPRRIPIEITTYRVDGIYSDGRHPDQVHFVASLTEDLRRRDFTINAMAMDLRGRVVDPFGGREDLEAGIIRAVGDPDTRFHEDGLRILRALRFAAVLVKPAGAITSDEQRPAELSFQIQPEKLKERKNPAFVEPEDVSSCKPDVEVRDPGVLAASTLVSGSTEPVRGFAIEPDTEAALFRCAPLLRGISAERIFVELKKLIVGPAAGDVVRRYVDILAVAIPELGAMKGFAQNNPYHRYDVLEHCIRAMEAIRPNAAVPGRVAPSRAPAHPTESAQPGVPANPGNATPPEASVPSGAPVRPAESAQPGAPARPDRSTLKLAALLHDAGKPRTYSEDENGIGHFYGHAAAGADVAREILRRLKADRATIEKITTLIRYHDLVFQEDERLLKRWLNRYTPQTLLEILELKRADNIATGNVSQELLDKFDRIRSQILDILQSRACFCMKDLAVSGRDLLERGIPEGPQIGSILNELLEAVIDGRLPNEKNALLERVQELRITSPASS